MGTVFLKDMMETRYIINALSMRFRRCLESAIENGDTVDFAECKFGPECAYMLNKYYGKVQMCNSADAYLDGLLKNNTAYRTEVIEEYEPLVLEGITVIDNYFELYNTLPNGGKFKVQCSLGSLACKATLVLLILSRPDLILDIRQCGSDIYDFVRDAWLTVAEHHDRYYELMAPDTVIRESTDGEYFGADSYGYQKETTFIRNRKVVPYEFGNTQIVNPDGSHPVEEEWRPVAEKCLMAFQQTNTERRSGKVLRNLLTFRED